MDTSKNDNCSADSGNNPHVSSISPPINTSTASNILITNSPRRSNRLSSKSPQIPSRTSTQSNIHRTMSGGVTNSHSPKLNNRKRNSFSRGRGSYSNSHSQSPQNNAINTRHGNNDTSVLHTNLPSDQSDDDVITSNNNTAAQPKSTGVASRSEILSYFEQQTDGFHCKLCHEVSLLVHLLEY